MINNITGNKGQCKLLPYIKLYAILASMLNIRLQRVGRRNDPSFRLVLINSKHAARGGKAIDTLGSVDFRKKNINPKDSFKIDKIKEYMKNGAQVSDTVFNIFVNAGIVEGKKKNVLPKKTPQKKAEAAK